MILTRDILIPYPTDDLYSVAGLNAKMNKKKSGFYSEMRICHYLRNLDIAIQDPTLLNREVLSVR